MRNTTCLLILVYIICTVCDSYASEHHGKRYGKVCLMPLLEGMLWMNDRKEILLYLALLMCWAGDLFLIHKNPKRNMAGMFCFLAGHLFYACLFASQITTVSVSYIITGIVIYGCFAGFYFMKIWSNASRKLKVPSSIYMMTIIVMSLLSFLSLSSGKTGSWITWTGTFLFLISDTLISDQLFRHLPQKGVMETYGPAQLLIVIGFLLS